LIHRNIFKTLRDFVWLVEIVEKYLGSLQSPGIFVNSYNNILKLGRLCMAGRNCRKILRTFKNSWSVCIFIEKCLEDFGRLDMLYRASRTSEKLFRTSRDYRNLSSILENCLEV